jgi:uncharacterized protein (DUF1800 family)
MALDPKLTALALQRFGLGARPGDLAQAGADPRDFLGDEVRRRSVAQPVGPDLMDTASAIAALRDQRQERRMEKMAARQPSDAAIGQTPPGQEAAPAMDGAGPKPAQPEPPVPVRLYRAEAMARITTTMDVAPGFVERLV